MASNAKEQSDILKVAKLFNELPSLSSLFGQLHDICQSLSNTNSTRRAFIWIIFELIWKNYLTLLDREEFVDGIIGDYCKDNHRFLRQYFAMAKWIVAPLPLKNSREIFVALVDRCNQSKRMQTYLENSCPNEILSNTCRSLLYICLKICNSLNLILTHNDLVKYQTDLFIRYLDRDFQRRENSREENLLIEQIRLFLRNRCSMTSTIPIFINAECPQACLRWLTLGYLNTNEYEFILLMLYSIARHDEGVMVLKNAECVKIVRQFQKNELMMRMDWILDKDWYSKIGRILDMIYALLIDPGELYLEESNTGTIKRLVLLSRTSLEHSQYICKEYHVGELLIILMKLCTDESMMDCILQQDQCPDFFILLLNRLLSNTEQDMNDLAITALVNILWSMSFDHRYQKHLIYHISLIKRLRQISPINTEVISIYRPSQMSSLKRTLDGIWQNLYPGQLEIKSPRSSNSSICSVMISYSPMNIDFCREFYNVLVQLPELSIYVDFKTGKYSWKEMAEMIGQADVVLFLLSNEFYQNKSCRQELIYVTDTLKKLFFPIFIDREFKPIGWLQKRVVRLKSIRFGEKDFLETCEDLLGLINENLSMNISLMKSSSDVKKWNGEDIEKWFIDQHLRLDLCDFYHFQNGQELLLYAQATLAFSWMKEYERIKVRFEEKISLSQEQFLKFIYALKRLLK